MRDRTKLSEANRNRTFECLVGGAVGDALGYVPFMFYLIIDKVIIHNGLR